jgi:hypothetical protein
MFPRGIPIPGRRSVRHASLSACIFRWQSARVLDENHTRACRSVSPPHHCAILRANERGHPCRYGIIGGQQSKNRNIMKAAVQVWMGKKEVYDIYTRWNNKNNVTLKTSESLGLMLGRRSQGHCERNAMLSYVRV